MTSDELNNAVGRIESAIGFMRDEIQEIKEQVIALRGEMRVIDQRSLDNKKKPDVSPMRLAEKSMQFFTR